MTNIKVSAELALLISASLKEDVDLRVQSESKEINWESVAKLVSWHQVRPLLFNYLENNNDFHIPENHAKNLKEFTIGQVVTNMTFLKISLDLYRQLREGEVKAFLMKGALWAWMLYEKPGSREFGDIDFFIEKHSIKESLDILAQNGFKPDAYRSYLLGKRSVEKLYLESDYQLPLQPVSDNALQSLEIQWDATYPRYCYSFSQSELADRMMDFQLLNISIKVPGMENQLLMMMIHHAGVEQWDKLKYLADFIRILRKSAHTLDWEYILKTASGKGYRRLLLESLGVVHVLTGENYLKYCSLNNSENYPNAEFFESIISHWENGRPVRKSKSWRILIYNLKYRDNFNQKLKIISAHLSYLTQWQLIWYKFVWYYRKISTNTHSYRA